MVAELDGTDRQILAALRADGRLSMRALAEQIHVSRANVYARVERLRETGVLRGFHADVDPAAAGFGTTAYVTLNLSQHHWRTLRERLQSLPGVEHIALVGGDVDVVLLVRTRDNAELRRLVLDEIQSIEGVLGTRTWLVFEEVDPTLRP